MAKPWKVHEDLVASLYQMLGYRVRVNQQVSGKQVDMTCEKWVPGAGKTLLYVDAKHTLDKKHSSVSVQDVEQFIASYESRRISEGWTGGVLVSNKPFTQFAAALATKHGGIYLKTVDGLREDALALRPYLHHSVDQYENQEIFQAYIPLRATEADSYAEPVGTAFDLIGAVDAWLENIEAPQLCLLGDFGCGKTTFLRRLHYQLASKYLSGSGSLVPLYIELRRLAASRDAREFLESFALDYLGARVPFHIFEEFASQGRFVFLLDGFDEMGAARDRLTRHRYYLKLAPLFSKASKIIISCRPAYFPSRRDLAATFGEIASERIPSLSIQRGSSQVVKDSKLAAERLAFHVADESLETLLERASGSLATTRYLYLQLFAKDQVTDYVQKFDSSIRDLSGGQMTSELLLKMIDEIYDLEDLAQRPILLNLIVRTLPLFVKSSTGVFTAPTIDKSIRVREITPSLLYYVYTMAEMTREYAKGEMRSDMLKADRLKLLKKFAFSLAATSRTNASRRELGDIIKDSVQPPDEVLPLMVSDMCVFSFLVRDEADMIRFAHKSLLEYFAGEYLVDVLSHDTASGLRHLKEHVFSDEVLFFAGSAASTRSPGATSIVTEALLKDHDRRFVYNALTFLAHAQAFPEAVRGHDADAIVLRKLRRDTQSFSEGGFGSLEFRRCQFEHLKFFNIHAGVVEIHKCRMSSLFLERSQVGELHADGTAFSLYLDESSIKAIQFASVTVSGRMSRSEVFIVGMKGSSLTRFEFEDSLVMAEADGFSGSQSGELRFKKCILFELVLDDAWTRSAVFEECTLIRCFVKAATPNPAFRKCRGVLILESGDVAQPVEVGPQLWGWSGSKAATVFEYNSEEVPPRLDWQLLKAFPAKRTRNYNWTREEVIGRLRAIQAKISRAAQAQKTTANPEGKP